MAGWAGASLILLAYLLLSLGRVTGQYPTVQGTSSFDELLASAVFLWSARTLGLKPIDFLRGRKEQKRLAAAKRELSSGG